MDRLSTEKIAQAVLAADVNRQYLINGRDPAVAPRLALALNAIVKYLETFGIVPFMEVAAVGVEYSDVKLSTVQTKLHLAVKHGLLRKTGEYKNGVDTRTLELVDWPVPSPKVLGATGNVVRATAKVWSGHKCPDDYAYPYCMMKPCTGLADHVAKATGKGWMYVCADHIDEMVQQLNDKEINRG